MCPKFDFLLLYRNVPTALFVNTMQYLTVKENEIPEGVWDDMTWQLEHYSTAIIIDDKFLGSGTLISWNGKFGVLTAEHVTNHPSSAERTIRFSVSSRQHMNLTVAPHAHNLKFEVRYLANITLGKRCSDEYGPDISVIVLPESPQLSAIRARKSFWQLAVRTREKLDMALENRGATAIAGHAEEEQVVTVGPRPYTASRAVPGFSGRTTQINYFERNGIDYVEVVTDKGPGTDTPNSFGGVSGGGLWRVQLRRLEENGQIVIRPAPYLLGVIFRQSAEQNGCRTLRAHGPKTIYESLLPRLEILSTSQFKGGEPGKIARNYS